MNSSRKLPWLSGLVAAFLGALWMIGQVIEGIVSVVAGLLSTPPPI
jgi:hypothetical protein